MTDKFKPMLAEDWFIDKLKFPCFGQFKIDGVNGCNRYGKALTRRLKPHANKFTTDRFSLSGLHGLCGEKVLGHNPTLQNLCRLTSSALSRIEGEPEIHWWLFDYTTEDNRDFSYHDRYAQLVYQVNILRIEYPELAHLLHIVDNFVLNNMEELLEFEAHALDLGYEGIILRDPNEKYKYGRCSKNHMGVWRVKRFIDAEILVTEIIEGNTNNNEKLRDELGYAKRSSNMENLVPNGMVGSIIGTLLDDVVDQRDGLLIAKNTLVTIAPGEMTHEERSDYWANPDTIIGKIAKFKLFPKGVKDKPRFPQFLSLRDDYCPH